MPIFLKMQSGMNKLQYKLDVNTVFIRRFKLYIHPDLIQENLTRNIRHFYPREHYLDEKVANVEIQ